MFELVEKRNFLKLLLLKAISETLDYMGQSKDWTK